MKYYLIVISALCPLQAWVTEFGEITIFSKAAHSLIRRHFQEGSQDKELIESTYMPSSQELSTESSSSSLMSGE